MKKDMLNIFITGARGFIGRNLVEYLARVRGARYTLFYPYHKELELLDGAKVAVFIRRNKIDIVLHCANVGGSRKTGYDCGRLDIVSSNLRMFFNLAKCIDSGKGMIFFGSGAEYDVRHYRQRMGEGYFDTYVPQDPYGFSKYICSKYIQLSENIINLRLFGVYGKYEDYEFKFISNSIVKNLLGLAITINQNVFFDYLYINDLVRITEYFINHKARHKFYNCVRGETIDLLTIANKINQISGRPTEIIVKNQGLNSEYSAHNRRLLEELGGYSYMSFDSALKELYFWYKQNLDKIGIDKEKIKADEYIKYCRKNPWL